MDKTVLSFYCDDTNPYDLPIRTFKTFLDFVSSEGIAGESSVILGYRFAEHGLLSRPSTDLQVAYIEQLQRAFACGIDAHVELMTHWGLYDFELECMPEEAGHEGVWLYEPAIPVEAYESYFGHIIAEGARVGVRFTGLTWPGCGCDVCTQRYKELRASGATDINSNVWQALLNLAQAERFRGHTVPCFIGGEKERGSAQLKAGDGGYGVYDLPPNAGDRFGIWLNDPDYVDADYYITADGESGRIVELVRAGAPYCLFYAHWQGLNPANGVGWDAFTRVIGRIQEHLRDRVIWMRPSEFTDHVLCGERCFRTSTSAI
jgi:hypothetical protein